MSLVSVTAVWQAYLDLDIQSFRDAQDQCSEAGDSLRIALLPRQANLQAETVSQVDELEAKLKASKKHQKDLEARSPLSPLLHCPSACICSLNAGDAERGAALGAASQQVHRVPQTAVSADVCLSCRGQQATISQTE